MTDDPFPGGGWPGEQDPPAPSGSPDYLNAPTVRARISPRAAGAGRTAGDGGAAGDETALTSQYPAAVPPPAGWQQPPGPPAGWQQPPPPAAGWQQPPPPAAGWQQPPPPAAGWQPYPPAVPPTSGGPRTGMVIGVVAGLVTLLIAVVGGGVYLRSTMKGTSTSAAPAATTTGAGVPGAGGTAPATAGASATDGATGTSASPPTNRSSTARPSPSVTAHQAGIEELRTGDCVQSLNGAHIVRLPVVDCLTPHEVQLAGIYTPKKGAYPGHDPLVRTGTAGCAPVIRGALRADAPPMANFPLVPAETTWRNGDRRVLCFVASGNQNNLTRSVLDTTVT